MKCPFLELKRKTMCLYSNKHNWAITRKRKKPCGGYRAILRIHNFVIFKNKKLDFNT
jgi:hypothetical protein